METTDNMGLSGSVRLRALEPSDTDCLYLWENNPELWPYGSVRAPMSRHQIWEYTTGYDANPFAAGQLRLIIELTDSDSKATPCGIIDLYDIDPMNSRAMVGIMVTERHRRTGVASRAVSLLSDYCRDILGLATIAAEVPADNTPSAALFQTTGFEEVGRRPSWYRRRDRFVAAILYQKDLRPTP